MLKLISYALAIVGLLFGQAAYSQQDQPGQSRFSYPQTMIFGQRISDVHETPVASFSTDYIYTFTDSQTGHNRSLMGWSAMPAVHLVRHLELQGDFVGEYVRSIYPGQNRLSMSAGLRYTLAPRSRFTPFFYGEGGEVRLTSQANHNSDWNPIVRGGLGLEHKVSRGIAFQLIPENILGSSWIIMSGSIVLQRAPALLLISTNSQSNYQNRRGGEHGEDSNYESSPCFSDTNISKETFVAGESV